ncbi:uncharacterized protein LOC121180992 [Toxotes jaculatrix]|uniref:uncharacterized protein LOC121180992 n=1 Tax=Toxotes jaculatrix TaxID=941984 RepID=UPI001B3AE44E|nr:uncharacterized protein LOC121180992 [Toxotes jaculatrix]
MEPIAAGLIFLLCQQIHNTGALPVGDNLASYPQEASGNGKEEPFEEEAVAAKTRNENSLCQIIPVTDDPLTEITTTLPPISVSKPAQGTHQKPPPPLPPNVYYLPVIPYNVLPPNPASGGSYVYGQGADGARLSQGRGQGLPHSPVAASGILPVPQWVLDLQREKQPPASQFLQSSINPKGDRRRPLLAQNLDVTSSETSSEEDSDSD